MKCLSIRQPWATLIVHGFTSCHVRSWRSAYRGPLAIHASLKLDADALELFRRPRLRQLFDAAGYASLFEMPRGRILGVVELSECQALRDLAEGVLSEELNELDSRAGKFVWRLVQPWVLIEPIVLSARRGIFDIPDLFPVAQHDSTALCDAQHSACSITPTSGNVFATLSNT